jgi:carbonic anhydrase
VAHNVTAFLLCNSSNTINQAAWPYDNEHSVEMWIATDFVFSAYSVVDVKNGGPRCRVMYV